MTGIEPTFRIVNVDVLTRRRALEAIAVLFSLLVTFASALSQNQEVKRARATDGASLPGGPPDRAAVDSATSGSISGRVTGEDGRPLPQARVLINSVGGQSSSRYIPVRADGTFKLEKVPAGVYRVNASAPGFTTAMDYTSLENLVYYRIGDNVNIRLVRGAAITGKVTNANGEPVVTAPIQAIRLKTLEGRALPLPQVFDRVTDDRGVYRIYGLPPGVYKVSAGGPSRIGVVFNAFNKDIMTFYPSATRDGASEVVVRSGEEVANIDIRYRGETGHSISGRIVGATNPVSPRFAFTLTLLSLPGGVSEGSTYVSGRDEARSFEFSGIADGDFTVFALRNDVEGGSAGSAPLSIRGGDVTGLEINVAPLAAAEGRLVLESGTDQQCKERRNASMSEFLVTVQREHRKNTPPIPFSSLPSGGAPNQDGLFKINNLFPGSYRLLFQLPSEIWFIRVIENGARAAASPAGLSRMPADSLQNVPTLSLSSGERRAGIIVKASPDGAAVQGRVESEVKGKQLPAHVLVNLVPADAERQNDLLRYSETISGQDGDFAVRNLAPGKYYVLARQVPDETFSDPNGAPSYLSAKERASLLKAIVGNKLVIDLKPCQSMTGLTVEVANLPK